MGKRILNLYVDDETIEIAKSKRINMSELFREILSAELKDTKNSSEKDKIKKLKLLNAKLSIRINELTKENDKFKKQELKRNTNIPWR